MPRHFFGMRVRIPLGPRCGFESRSPHERRNIMKIEIRPGEGGVDAFNFGKELL
jgi:hypothetical protein